MQTSYGWAYRLQRRKSAHFRSRDTPIAHFLLSRGLPPVHLLELLHGDDHQDCQPKSRKRPAISVMPTETSGVLNGDGGRSA